MIINDFWRAYSLFVSLLASFAPSLRSGANDVIRATNKLYALQKPCDCPINYRHLEANDSEKLICSLIYQLQLILFFFLLAE